MKTQQGFWLYGATVLLSNNSPKKAEKPIRKTNWLLLSIDRGAGWRWNDQTADNCKTTKNINLRKERYCY